MRKPTLAHGFFGTATPSGPVDAAGSPHPRRQSMLSRLTGGRFGEGKHRREAKVVLARAADAAQDATMTVNTATTYAMKQGLKQTKQAMKASILTAKTVLHMPPAPRPEDQTFELLITDEFIVAHDLITIGNCGDATTSSEIHAHDVLRITEEASSDVAADADASDDARVITLEMNDREPISFTAPDGPTSAMWTAHIAMVSGASIVRDTSEGAFDRWPSAIRSSLPSSAAVLRRMLALDALGFVDEDRLRNGLGAELATLADEESAQLACLRTFVLEHSDETALRLALSRCGFDSSARFERMSSLAVADCAKNCLGQYIVGVVHFFAEELFDEADVRSGGTFVDTVSQGWRRTVAKTLLAVPSQGVVPRLMRRAVLNETEPVITSPKTRSGVDLEARTQRKEQIATAGALLVDHSAAVPETAVLDTIDEHLGHVIACAARLAEPQSALDALHTFMSAAARGRALRDGATARHVAIALLRRVDRGAALSPVESAVDNIVHVLRWYIVYILEQADATAREDRAAVAALECAVAVANCSLRTVERVQSADDGVGEELLASEVEHLCGERVVGSEIERRERRGAHNPAFGRDLQAIVFQKVCGEDPLHPLLSCCRYVAAFAQSVLRAPPDCALVEGFSKRAGPGALALYMAVDPAHVSRLVECFERGDCMSLASALPSIAPDSTPACLEYRVRVALKVVEEYVTNFPGGLIPRKSCMVLTKRFLVRQMELKKRVRTAANAADAVATGGDFGVITVAPHAHQEETPMWTLLVKSFNDVQPDERRQRISIVALVLTLLHRLVDTLEDSPVGRDGRAESPPLSVELDTLIGPIILGLYESPAMRVHTLSVALLALIRNGEFPLNVEGEDSGASAETPSKERENSIALDATLDPASESAGNVHTPLKSPIKRRRAALAHRTPLRSATSELRIAVSNLDGIESKGQSNLEMAHIQAMKRRRKKQRKAKRVRRAPLARSLSSASPPSSAYIRASLPSPSVTIVVYSIDSCRKKCVRFHR